MSSGKCAGEKLRFKKSPAQLPAKTGLEGSSSSDGKCGRERVGCPDKGDGCTRIQSLGRALASASSTTMPSQPAMPKQRATPVRQRREISSRRALHFGYTLWWLVSRIQQRGCRDSCCGGVCWYIAYSWHMPMTMYSSACLTYQLGFLM